MLPLLLLYLYIIHALVVYVIALIIALITVSISALIIFLAYDYLPGKWWQKGLVLALASPLIYGLIWQSVVFVVVVLSNPPEWLVTIMKPLGQVVDIMNTFLMNVFSVIIKILTFLSEEIVLK
jgi:hypothetical protein